jgi:hypothetical protein
MNLLKKLWGAALTFRRHLRHLPGPAPAPMPHRHDGAGAAQDHQLPRRLGPVGTVVTVTALASPATRHGARRAMVYRVISDAKCR